MPPISRSLVLTAASLVLLAGSAAADPDQAFIEGILSNLPPLDSANYSSIYDAASRPHRENLDMTGAEVWRIPRNRWPAASAAAEKAGVTLTRLGETWNHVLLPANPQTEMTATQKVLMHGAMDSKAAMGMVMMALPEASIEEYALTNDLHETGAPQTEIVIPIASGKSVTARRLSVARVGSGYAWHGVVEETGEPVTLLWWPSGKMSGSVTYRGHVYAAHDLGGGMHAIVDMNPRMMPEEHAPLGFGMMKKMHLKEDPLVMRGAAGPLLDSIGKQSPPSPEQVLPRPDRQNLKNQEDAGPSDAASTAPGPLEITHAPLPASETREQAVVRIIIAYTKAAAAHYSDIETDLIPLAIEQANESFRMSGITNVQLELAYAYETNYVENGTHFEHVFRFADQNDGYMDEVHALRDKYRADVGILIVNDPHGCGLSAEVHARPERAFAVVHHECAANMYSLAHEIGHLIGARHDEALDDSKEPFPFGHGFVSGKSWRTMMAYKDGCDGCPRVPIWSSPMVKVRGVAAGNAQSDNARVIAENAARVAAFR